MSFKPQQFSDLIPDEEVDEFGYVWKKITTDHTIELVGFDGDVEMGIWVLGYDDSEEATQRREQMQWVEDRVEVMYPDGMTLNRIREVIRNQHETYGTSFENSY